MKTAQKMEARGLAQQASLCAVVKSYCIGVLDTCSTTNLLVHVHRRISLRSSTYIWLYCNASMTLSLTGADYCDNVHNVKREG